MSSSLKSCEGYLWTPNGSTEGLATDACIPTPGICSDSYDIIVIGSGFAGLAAARDLSQHTPARILLLEARDRIGGRTWTAKVAGEDIEMGGTWVHWNQPHVFCELHRYDLHQYLKTSAGTMSPEVQYYKGGDGNIQQLSPLDVADLCEKVAIKLFQVNTMDSKMLMPYPHDPFREPMPWKKFDHLSVGKRLDELSDIPQFDKDVFETMVNSIGSAPASETGLVELLRWYALGGHSIAGMFELAGIHKLGKGGMTTLALAILGDFRGDLLLNSPVTSIIQDSAGALVVTKTGKRIKSKAIISTIPLNCLNDVFFHPPISPLRREAMNVGHINKGAKIHFKLASTQPGWFATCVPSPNSPYVFAFSDHNGTQPSGPDGTWCIGFGYNGNLIDKKDNKHIVDSFKKNIKSDADVRLYATHDWMNDPYAKGTWSCWGPGTMSKYLKELQKDHGRVLFANADWADGWRGFVDGALERGKVAARDAAKFLDAFDRPKL